jgi:2-phospho-L-lactate guanylyltransferase
MWAIVPLKSPHLAKSRLAAVLSSDERRACFFELAQRAIHALRATRGIEQVAVVTADEEVAAFARSLGAHVLPEVVEAGTAQAFSTALEQLRPHALRQILMVAGDLPLVSSRALEVVVDAASRHEIVIVPDRFQAGTNALACSPPDAIAPCFGPDSYARHLAAARASGRTHCTLSLDELAFDIDVPADLEHLRRQSRGIIERLPIPRARFEPAATLA